MEHINKVELQGVISSVNEIPIGNMKKLYIFSLCTSCTNGFAVENVWHQIQFVGEPDGLIENGKIAHIDGCITTWRFMTTDDKIQITYFISASKVKTYELSEDL